jgi:LysR family transcriptional regulator, hydrogen peroxide-inducible genes activator
MLTPVGKEIATRAQRLLVDAEELVGWARNAQEPLSGPLRFGIIPTVGPYVLPSLLSHLGTALPKLKLYVREAPTSVLLDKLAGGELDIPAKISRRSRRYACGPLAFRRSRQSRRK